MIGLSPLPSIHPEAFQRLSVRTSSVCYHTFILTKGRSQGFASTPTDCTPYSDSLSLRLLLFTELTLPVRVTRRLIMQKARRHTVLVLRPLVSVWFQVLFSLTRWCWQFQTGRLRPRPTQDTHQSANFTNTGLSPSLVCLPRQFSFFLLT